MDEKIKRKTEFMKDANSPHGYLHVKKNRAEKYYCFYKGINTGLHPTPHLAAFVLQKLCKKFNVDLELEEVPPELAEPYPECDLPVPDYVLLKDIAYLRDTTKRSGYRGVNLLDARGTRSFACKMIHMGKAMTTERYPTPAEAAWALHCRDLVIERDAYIVPTSVDAEEFGPVDVDTIAYLKDDSLSCGYHHVRWHDGKYEGHYTVDELTYVTHRYKFAQDAAWAVHHHLEAAAARRTTQVTKAKNQVVPIRIAELVSGFHQELAGIRKTVNVTMKRAACG